MSDFLRLSSLSTRTLTLVLERQRLASFPGAPLPASQLTQISRNLETLRDGILHIEDQGYNEAQTVRALRQQWERMKDMLGDEGRSIAELPSPPMSPPPPPPKSHSKHMSESDTIFAPYKDDDDTPYNDPTNPSPYDASPDELLQQQREMMDVQDTHLDVLSASINRQREISLGIGNELEVHEGLLGELDHGLDRTHGRLSGARKRLDRVGRGAKENASAVTIGLLIFVLLILIVVFKT